MITSTQFGALKINYDNIKLEAVKDCTVAIAKLRSTMVCTTETSKSNFLKQFFTIKELMKHGLSEIKIYNKENAPDWNIFRILGLERKEVGFHTPFLAALISPNGAHGQGQFFLETFLQDVAGFCKSDIDTPGWYIRSETDYVDLRIANDNLRKAVFIENKIDTGAHSGQLSSYFKIWQCKYPSGGIFAYLTINGNSPSDQGFYSVSSRKEVESFLVLLSYKHDILGWLKKITPEITPPTLKQSIAQYIDVINQL